MNSKKSQPQFHFVTINSMCIFLRLNQRLWAMNGVTVSTTSPEQTKSVDQSHSSEGVFIYSRECSALMQP